jgi:hypothetical protein
MHGRHVATGVMLIRLWIEQYLLVKSIRSPVHGCSVRRAPGSRSVQQAVLP